MSTTTLLRLPAVMDRTGLSKPTIYRKITLGEFPKPRKVGRISVWPVSDIEKWIGGVLAGDKREG